MRRRSQVSLVLASSLSLVLSGCEVSFDHDNDPQQTHHFDQTVKFTSVQQCVDQKLPVTICSDAFIQAQNEHRRTAPHYDTQQACDADFVPGYCQADGQGGFMPKVGDFEIHASGTLTDEQYRQAQTEAQSQMNGHGSSVTGAVVGGGAGLLTGYMLGKALSNNRSTQYQSHPASPYPPRQDDRDSSTSGSYRPAANNSSKWRSGNGDDSARTRDSLGNNLRNNGASASNGWDSRSSDRSARQQDQSRTSAASSVSRGGFGSEATARSGWSGASRSGSSWFSFGG